MFSHSSVVKNSQLQKHPYSLNASIEQSFQNVNVMSGCHLQSSVVQAFLGPTFENSQLYRQVKVVKQYRPVPDYENMLYISLYGGDILS